MNSKPFSKRTFLTTSLAAFCGCGLHAVAANSGSPGPKRLRLGTFDSRAIAIAAVNSGANEGVVAKARAEYEAAKASNDTARMKSIKDRMNLRQRRQHEQGFSTASVINLLEPVRSRLQQVAREAGVDVIVSKWELAYQSEAVEVVDVTEAVVDLYLPSSKARKWIEDISTKPPVPIDELAEHVH